MKIPLLHDHHTHISLYAALNDAVDIGAISNTAELAAKLRQLDDQRINVVLGWDTSRLALDEKFLAPFPPVLVNDRSLHGFIMNDKAREMLRESYGDIVERYHDPLFRERSVGRLMQMLVTSAGLDEAKVEHFLARRRAEGVAGVTEMLLTHASLLALIARCAHGAALACYTDPDIYRKFSGEARASITGIKIFTDGSLGARTAALSVPYLCGSIGILNYTDEALLGSFAEIAAWGKQLAVHALGDLAIQQVARVATRLERSGIRLVRPRMEHAQVIDLASARILKDLGFILSMQPNFATDTIDYADRLPPGMAARINPLRMLIDEAGFVPGDDLIFGSDGMPHGAVAAVGSALFPPLFSQRLSLEELVAGYRGPLSDAGHIELAIDHDTKRVDIHEIVWHGPLAAKECLT